jgi:ABC-type Mn2+/Zn2+ transport system permease subunit
MPTTEAVLATVWDALSGPWHDGTVVRAFAEVGLIGAVGGVLGCWIVLYGLSYGGESLAHAMFPGLVGAALLGLPLIVGGAAGLAVAAVAIAAASRTPQVGGDTAIAVVVTTLFGLGALLALSPASPPGIQGLLFGDVLGLSGLDLLLSLGLGVVVLAALWILHGRLLAVGFDRSSARSLGAAPAFVDTALLLLIAAAILVAVQGLGNLLVVAVLIAPAATARLLARRLAPMMALAAALAVLAGAAGLYLSYYARTAGGASIAGMMVAFYVVALAATSLRPRIVSGHA